MDLENELLNLDNQSSVIRGLCEKTINLIDSSIEPLIIPEYFFDNSFCPENEKNILEAVLVLRRLIIENGFDSKLTAGVHEAMRNAYQHGNNKDPKKKIILRSSLNKKNARFIIGDQGGIIHPDFFPYVLRYRICNDYFNPLDFYKFSSKERLPENGGIGLMTMHLVFDSVRFFKDVSGGLLTYLEKRK